MKRAFLSLCLLLLLAILTQKANSACDPITVVNNLPDTVKVGFGGKLDLSAEFTAPDIPVDSCGIGILNWEAKPNGGSPYSVTGTPIASPDTGTAYTISWRPANAETLRLVPYVVDSLTVPTAHYSSDTTVVIVKSGLWFPEAVHYMGSFRVDRTDPNWSNQNFNASFSENGGTMLTYCPDGEAGDSDGYPGSLYANGYWAAGVGCWISQITIPTPVIDPLHDPDNLPMADYIQNFTDAFSTGTASWIHYPGSERKPGDLLYTIPQGQVPYAALYYTFRTTYTAEQDFFSLGRCPADLNDTRPSGLWHLGARVNGQDYPWPAYHYRSWGDYLFAAPLSWANLYTGGKWMIAGMADREAGTNGASQGPTMYAFDPGFAERGGCYGNQTAGCDTSIIPTVRLLQYPFNSSPGGQCDSLLDHPYVDGYSKTDAWSDGAWINSGGRQAIVFIGQKCQYTSHYWDDAASLCNLQGVCTTENKGWVCGTPSDASPGYQLEMLFYDPDDIAQVALGNWNPWDPQPYATLDLGPYAWAPTRCAKSPGGLALDNDNGRLFFSEQEDSTQSGSYTSPIIHVFDMLPWESYLSTMTLTGPSYSHLADTVHVSLTWDLQTTADCTFATDSTSVTSVSIVVADSIFVSDSAPLANGATAVYEADIPCPTAGVMNVRGRIVIDASGSDCDGTFDTDIKPILVLAY